MTECESTRGKWSTRGQKPNRCPSCKGPMPYRPEPLRSWMATREHDPSKVATTVREPFTGRYVFSLHRRKAA